MDAIKMKQSSGYSLVEVMVAMVISLIILSGVYKLITDETINAARDEAVLDMQNNARAAMARIAGDLRRAGFFGCGGKQSYPAAPFTFDAPIVFSNDDAAAAANIDDGTDSITLAFLAGDVPLEPAPAANTISTVTTKDFTLARKAFATGEPLLITDCDQYAIFTKTNPTDNTLLLQHGGLDLKRAYGAPLPARAYRFESSAYRVEGADLRLNGQVVAENIEDLQFEFVEDTDQDGVLDEAWSETFTNAEDVRVIRVWVLAMSDPAYTYTDNNTYDYPNSPYYDTTSVGLPVYWTDNGGGGSPAGLTNDRKHRYRYLASSIIYLRNAGII